MNGVEKSLLGLSMNISFFYDNQNNQGQGTIYQLKEVLSAKTKG